MADLVKISDERFAELLAAITPPEPIKVGASRQHLREQVVLLSAFDASLLRANASSHAEQVEIDRFLVEDCDRVMTRNGPRWSLRSDIRALMLTELDEHGRLRDFSGITDDTDIACRMAGQYIRGTAPSLSEQSFEELHGTVLAAEWFRDTTIEAPLPAEARRRHTIEAMLQPLRTLVANGFVGREHELATLSDYAEVLPPTKRVAGAARRIRRILNMSEKPPMVIHGPGGVGKSTLIAKFVLDHVDAGEVHRFPFAYLSFDRPELNIEQPLTLLAEAASQMATLFPKVETEASAFSQSVRSTVSASVASTADRRSSRSSSSATRDRARRDDVVLLERFSSLVRSATGKHNLPNVWVLDTFEVAQRHGPTAVDRLWEFLERFQEECPSLRVIFAGRVPIDGHETQDLALGDLDSKSALHMLKLQLDDLHAPDEFLARVAELIPPYPAGLRFAVLYIRSESARLGSEDGRREVLFRLQDDQVQGVLYRRILDHIADLELRRIAHPGLVVRKLTPDIIRHVLAKPCGLANVSDARARELFEHFGKEVALVRPDGLGNLVQLAEVRQLMLPMMRRESPTLVLTLQRSALRYYHSHRSNPAILNRTEELYYRLALGQATSTLDAAFEPDAGIELLAVIDEFPASSRVYLLNRLGLSVAPELLDQADDLSWARQAAAHARRLLDAGDPRSALEQISARHNDTVTPITAALEIEALAALKRRGEALDLATDVLKWATDHADAEMFIDVGLLAARVAEDDSQFERALGWLRAVVRSAAGANDTVAELTAQVAIVRIHRRSSGTRDSDEERAARQALREVASRLSARERTQNPSLIRDLAAEVGDEVPSIAQEALRQSGYDTEQPVTKRRRRRAAKAKLTSAEEGLKMSEAVGSADEDVASVTAKFRTESDESAF